VHGLASRAMPQSTKLLDHEGTAVATRPELNRERVCAVAPHRNGGIGLNDDGLGLIPERSSVMVRDAGSRSETVAVELRIDPGIALSIGVRSVRDDELAIGADGAGAEIEIGHPDAPGKTAAARPYRDRGLVALAPRRDVTAGPTPVGECELAPSSVPLAVPPHRSRQGSDALPIRRSGPRAA